MWKQNNGAFTMDGVIWEDNYHEWSLLCVKNIVVKYANLRIKKLILNSSNLIFYIRTVVSRGGGRKVI